MLPAGDSLLVRAKYVQLVDKNPGRAVFWAAINSRDRWINRMRQLRLCKSLCCLCLPLSQDSLAMYLLNFTRDP
ncbi:unnamed protein product [Rhodiola kirilowii]